MPPLLWNVPPLDVASQTALSRDLGTSSVLGGLLLNRGLKDGAAARAWLHPRLSHLEDPMNLVDMDVAAERLNRAIRDKEHVVIYGDYDVDGITGTVILMNFLRLCGASVDSYIPNRLKEGYSFNLPALTDILQRDLPPRLVITVDHGTNAHEGIAFLAQHGVDVLVTDHHEPPKTLPEHAHAIVNPKRRECGSTFKGLCGAGVAFKLAWAAAQKFSGAKKVSPEFRDFLLESMALVAVATVADVVPLHGENRILCHHGLQALAVTKNLGLKALLRQARLKGRVLRAVHVGFRIGPRLNAAGRLGKAQQAIDLLTATNEEEAAWRAKDLEQANDHRRVIEREMLQEILTLPEIRKFPGGRGICLGQGNWHAGVIGIVASRLVDRFHVPVLLIALNGAQGRGSARTAGDVHLKEVLDELTQHMVTHGGHAGAAGCTVTEESYPELRAGFERVTARLLALRPVVRSLSIDLEIPFRVIRPSMVEELEYLAPHGAGNPLPTFCTRGVLVAGRVRRVGKERTHIAFFARQGQKTFRAVGFNLADALDVLNRPGAHVDLAYRLKFDSYDNPGGIELEVLDVQPSAAP